MKTTFSLFFLYFVLIFSTLIMAETIEKYNVNINGPDIIGEWQIGTSIVSSSKLNTYVFSLNKKFEYNTSGQDALVEVIKIKGDYYFKHDTLFVKPTYILKRVGGHLSKNVETPINDFWEMNGGLVKLFKIPNPISYPLIIKIVKAHHSLNIDGQLYCKI